MQERAYLEVVLCSTGGVRGKRGIFCLHTFYVVLMKLFSNIYQFSAVPVVTAYTFVYFVSSIQASFLY